MTSRAVVYLRVSTSQQGKSGLGLEAQREAVAAYAKANGLEIVAEHVEIESGKRTDRPQLAAALAQAQRIKGKLIVAKLDRLARNVAFISRLMDAGVDFVAVDTPFANRLTLHILAAVAEHEREMISTRTKAALAAAKARGVKLGGLRGDAHLIAAQANRVKARQRAQTTLAVVEQIRRSGIVSQAGIARELTARGIPTSRGKAQWHQGSVRQLMRLA